MATGRLCWNTTPTFGNPTVHPTLVLPVAGNFEQPKVDQKVSSAGCFYHSQFYPPMEARFMKFGDYDLMYSGVQTQVRPGPYPKYTKISVGVCSTYAYTLVDMGWEGIDWTLYKGVCSDHKIMDNYDYWNETSIYCYSCMYEARIRGSMEDAISLMEKLCTGSMDALLTYVSSIPRSFLSRDLRVNYLQIVHSPIEVELPPTPGWTPFSPPILTSQHLESTYNAGCAGAYLNCIENIPKAQCNMLENIKDIFDTIKGVASLVQSGGVSGTLRNVVKSYDSFAKGWLAYRYSYLTTKSDVDELTNLVTRLSNLKAMASETITLRGAYALDGVLYRCSARFALTDIIPDTLSEKLEAVGLCVNRTNLWDMVPYSFVADWFLDFGDWLSYLDLQDFAARFIPIGITYSVEVEHVDGVEYIRFPGKPCTAAGQQFYESKKSSNKVWGMRLMDCLAFLD